MLTIQDLSYTHPDKELLFSNINLIIEPGAKIALIGNNGAGKSTLLKIVAGILTPSDVLLKMDVKPYYIPQIFGQYNRLTIAEALRVDKKLKALHEILKGNVSEENYDLLNDDWAIEDRIKEALKDWRLADLDLSTRMRSLSGGQKTKVFLAGISIHQPELVLLDEPSNHLDLDGRRLLYDFVQNAKQTLIVVSHDRRLLNLLNMICDLSKDGIAAYGGNYDFYIEQKRIAINALAQDIHGAEKALKKAKDRERETVERQRKLDARAKKSIGNAALPKIVANTRKNSAERSTAKIAGVHAAKVENIKQELQRLRSSLSETDQIRFGFDRSKLHKGKSIFIARHINFWYEGKKAVWGESLDLQIVSGERISIRGANGSGKTTLIRLILGSLEPQEGSVYRSEYKSVYIDQDYSLINNDLKVYEQAQQFNTTGLQEHEIKIRQNRFLFSKEDWKKPCGVLSGGERMRLLS